MAEMSPMPLLWSRDDGLPDCDACRTHLLELAWSALGAAASVGIGHRTSTSGMLRAWMSVYHQLGRHEPGVSNASRDE
jgi:hypothetical protein